MLPVCFWRREPNALYIHYWPAWCGTGNARRLRRAHPGFKRIYVFLIYGPKTERRHTHARTHARTHASFTPTRIHQLTRRPPRPQLRFRIADTAQSARKRFEAEPPEDKSTWGAEHKSALQQVITNINDLQRPAPAFDGLKPEVCPALHSLIGVGRERVLGVARAHELVPSEHI